MLAVVFFKLFFFFFLKKVVAGRRLVDCSNCYVNIEVKKKYWPRTVIFEGKTQNSNFGSEPVFNDKAFTHSVESVTYLMLTLTVMSNEKRMYQWEHEMSGYAQVHGWVDLVPLTESKPDQLPPQLNLSLDFYYDGGPLHLMLLKPYMSKEDLAEVAKQTEVREREKAEKKSLVIKIKKRFGWCFKPNDDC